MLFVKEASGIKLCNLSLSRILTLHCVNDIVQFWFAMINGVHEIYTLTRNDVSAHSGFEPIWRVGLFCVAIFEIQEIDQFPEFRIF